MKAAEVGKKIIILRTALLGMALAVMVILIGTFVALYKQMIFRFREAEQRENISISVGFAYADRISETTIKQLLDEADRQMYAEKQLTHRTV